MGGAANADALQKLRTRSTDGRSSDGRTPFSSYGMSGQPGPPSIAGSSSSKGAVQELEAFLTSASVQRTVQKSTHIERERVFHADSDAGSETSRVSELAKRFEEDAGSEKSLGSSVGGRLPFHKVGQEPWRQKRPASPSSSVSSMPSMAQRPRELDPNNARDVVLSWLEKQKDFGPSPEETTDKPVDAKLLSGAADRAAADRTERAREGNRRRRQLSWERRGRRPPAQPKAEGKADPPLAA